jgi:septal ring factor EnvC (AmiA/AmiB activator)
VTTHRVERLEEWRSDVDRERGSVAAQLRALAAAMNRAADGIDSIRADIADVREQLAEERARRRRRSPARWLGAGAAAVVGVVQAWKR